MSIRGLITAASFGICSTLAIAQTNVTTTNGGSVGSVPVFTSGANIENSAITQSGGNVGIGTTLTVNSTTSGQITEHLLGSDNADLVIQGASGSAPAFWLTGTGTALEIGGNGGTEPSSGVLNVTASGTVGIGTMNPSATLQVNGTTRVDGDLTVNGAGGVNVAGGGITFPDGTVQTTAYPATISGGSAPLQFVTNANENNENEAEIDGGVSANGSGIKHVRTDASCTATMSQFVNGGLYAVCTVVVDWPGTPFADTNYTVTCNAKNVSALPYAWNILVPDSGKTTSSATVTFVLANPNGGLGSATLQGLNCIAIHD